MSKHQKIQPYHQVWQQLLIEGLKLPEYKMLKERKYNNPRGYQAYEKVSQLMATQILNGYKFPWDLIKTDFATQSATTINTQIANVQAPVYWLSQSLLESFLHTDLPNWICGMQRPIPTAILMLPIGFICSPDGESINYIAFRHTKAFENPPSIRFKRQLIVTEATNFDYITWTTTTDLGTVYASCVGLQMMEDGDFDHGKHHFDVYDKLGIKIDEKAENVFLRTIDSIVLQTLLLMQIRPNIGTNSSASVSANLGFSKAHKQQHAYPVWSPNWIGKEYLPTKQIQAAGARNGNHASPRQHWRRGHFRRIVVGSKSENQRQWHWFEPVLVNANLFN